VVEDRLGDVLGRDADLLSAVDVGDTAPIDGLGPGTLQLALVPLQKALPIDGALVLGVETPVDEVGHGLARLLSSPVLERLMQRRRNPATVVFFDVVVVVVVVLIEVSTMITTTTTSAVGFGISEAMR
jgi:hypothetical protein